MDEIPNIPYYSICFDMIKQREVSFDACSIELEGLVSSYFYVFQASGQSLAPSFLPKGLMTLKTRLIPRHEHVYLNYNDAIDFCIQECTWRNREIYLFYRDQPSNVYYYWRISTSTPGRVDIVPMNPFIIFEKFSPAPPAAFDECLQQFAESLPDSIDPTPSLSKSATYQVDTLNADDVLGRNETSDATPPPESSQDQNDSFSVLMRNFMNFPELIERVKSLPGFPTLSKATIQGRSPRRL
jgi:hypothetical protein